jgi:toxin CptA
VIAALGVIGLLGALAIFGSEMPRLLAWPLAVGAVSRAAWLAQRESRRSRCELVWPMDAEPMIDGQVLQQAQLQWRGPLAFLHWRDDEGRQHRLAWWPDTLSQRARRELRLAAASCASTPPRASMAP